MFCLIYLYSNIHVTTKYIKKYSTLNQSGSQFYEILVEIRNFQNLRTLYILNVFEWACKNYNKLAAQAESKTREVLGIWKLSDNNFSSPSHPLHNYSFPFVPNLPPTPPLHLTLTARETFFLTKRCCRLIFKPSFLLLLISFTLFTFPSASCWTFLL